MDSLPLKKKCLSVSFDHTSGAFLDSTQVVTKYMIQDKYDEASAHLKAGNFLLAISCCDDAESMVQRLEETICGSTDDQFPKLEIVRYESFMDMITSCCVKIKACCLRRIYRDRERTLLGYWSCLSTRLVRDDVRNLYILPSVRRNSKIPPRWSVNGHGLSNAITVDLCVLQDGRYRSLSDKALETVILDMAKMKKRFERIFKDYDTVFFPASGIAPYCYFDTKNGRKCYVEIEKTLSDMMKLVEEQ